MKKTKEIMKRVFSLIFAIIMVFSVYGTDLGYKITNSSVYAQAATTTKWKKSKKTVYAKNGVKIRKKASLNSKELGTLGSGKKITRLAYSNKGWTKVSYKGATGYIKTKYLSEKKFKAGYKTFLKNNEHEKYITDWYFGSAEKYCIMDINNDGLDELIIISETSMGFYNFAVFGYNHSKKKIYPIEKCSQFYSSFKYSKKYKSLVYFEERCTFYYGYFDYMKIKNKKLKSNFSIGFETNPNTNVTKYHKFTNGKTTKLSEKAYNKYINEAKSINFKYISSIK